MRGRRWLSFLMLLSACGPAELAPPPNVSFTAESGEPLSNVPAVDRYLLGGLFDVELDQIWLVEGDVSSASQKRLRAFEVPDTVEKSRVPMAAWVEEGGAHITLAPSIPLEPRGRYSVVVLGVGLIAVLEVADEERERLWRWGLGPISSGEEVSYCRVPPPFFVASLALFDGQTLPNQDGEFVPLHVPELGDLCIRARAPVEERTFFIPPPRLGEFLVEPTPIPLGTTPPISDADPCLLESPQSSFERGCLRSSAGGVELSLAAGDYAVRISAADGGETFARALHRSSGRPFFLGPIPADSDLVLDWVSLDASEAPPASEVHFRSGPAAPRFVLTEVLANPAGAEPQGEWVEIFNAGDAPGSLLGLVIGDETGGVPLPDTVLQSGEYGVIVREDFAVGRDVAPAAAAIPIWVSALGGNGLRNSGEVVELRGSDGTVMSRVVVGDAPEGVSWARTSHWAADVPESYARHGEPGCSPGAENSFDEE